MLCVFYVGAFLKIIIAIVMHFVMLRVLEIRSGIQEVHPTQKPVIYIDYIDLYRINLQLRVLW